MANVASQRDSLRMQMLHSKGQPVQFTASNELVDYDRAVAMMESRVDNIRNQNLNEQVWFLEHSPLLTAGTSANEADLIEPDLLPVFKTGRGGEYTYHGPGQRVCYCMLDLSKRGQDIRNYVACLEQWIINALDRLNIKAERRENRVGVWVSRPDKPRLSDGSIPDDKIAAVGIRVRKWVAFHGISINVDPDLSHYNTIVPCGVTGHGVTSLLDLGHTISMEEFDTILLQEFENIFGGTIKD